MEVKVLIANAGRRPPIELSPRVVAHLENRNGGFRIDSGVRVLQPEVKPLQRQFIEIDGGFFAKVHRSDVSHHALADEGTVAPWADKKSLGGLRLRRPALFLYADEVRQSTM